MVLPRQSPGGSFSHDGIVHSDDLVIIQFHGGGFESVKQSIQSPVTIISLDKFSPFTDCVAEDLVVGAEWIVLVLAVVVN